MLAFFFDKHRFFHHKKAALPLSNGQEVKEAMTDANHQLTGWMEDYGDLIVRTCCLYLGDLALAEDALAKQPDRLLLRVTDDQGREERCLFSLR